jgi:hypothetical protein
LGVPVILTKVEYRQAQLTELNTTYGGTIGPPQPAWSATCFQNSMF